MNLDTLQTIINQYKSLSKYSDKLKISLNKDSSFSVFVDELLIFKLIEQSKQYKLMSKFNLSDFTTLDTKEGFAIYQINLNDAKDLNLHIQLIFKGIDKFVYDNYTTYTFGCCSRFVACSDAKHCIHPDELHAKGCIYKTNLDAGRIFYGKNKNI